MLGGQTGYTRRKCRLPSLGLGVWVVRRVALSGSADCNWVGWVLRMEFCDALRRSNQNLHPLVNSMHFAHERYSLDCHTNSPVQPAASAENAAAQRSCCAEIRMRPDTSHLFVDCGRRYIAANQLPSLGFARHALTLIGRLHKRRRNKKIVLFPVAIRKASTHLASRGSRKHALSLDVMIVTITVLHGHQSVRLRLHLQLRKRAKRSASGAAP